MVSKSPRRRHLLKIAGYQYDSTTVEVSEITNKNLNPRGQCLDLACLKMKCFLEKNQASSLGKTLILTCDTMVEFEGENLGKPRDKGQARDWIKGYAQSAHQVHTGCCLWYAADLSKTKNWVTSTKVYFGEVDDARLENYFSKHPDFMTKAGGYGIQDEHFPFITKIEGSYSNVVGLPLEALQEKILELKSEL